MPSMMKDTLSVLNQMQADRVIGQYAIAGAVAATFYLEPAATFDIDILVVLPNLPGSSLITLSPIYQYLTSRGSRLEGEHVRHWRAPFQPKSTA